VVKMKNIKKYENIVILKGSITEEEARKEIEEIKKYFEDVETFEKANDVNGFMGLKNLAYTVKGESKGYYYITYFKGAEEQASKIDLKIRANDIIIKFITIRTN